MTTELENPYILIYDKKVSSMKDLLPVLEKVVQSGSAAAHQFAEDVEGEALATLVVNKLRGSLKIAAVKAPGFGDRRKGYARRHRHPYRWYRGFRRAWIQAGNATLDYLGQAASVTIGQRDNTVIVDGKGSADDIQARVNQDQGAD